MHGARGVNLVWRREKWSRATSLSKTLMLHDQIYREALGVALDGFKCAADWRGSTTFITPLMIETCDPITAMRNGRVRKA